MMVLVIAWWKVPWCVFKTGQQFMNGTFHELPAGKLQSLYLYRELYYKGAINYHPPLIV